MPNARILPRLFASVVLILLAAVAPACDKHAAEKDTIRMVWNDYSTAYNNSDGKTLADSVTKSTIDHYTRLLSKALTASQKDVFALTPVEQRDIIRIRNRASKSQIKGYTGKGYLIYSTNQGWFAESNLSELKVTTISINGDSASAALTYEGEVVARKLQFVKEDGAWKFDHTSLFPIINDSMQRRAGMLRVSMRDYVQSREQQAYGSLKPTVWEPMK